MTFLVAGQVYRILTGPGAAHWSCFRFGKMGMVPFLYALRLLVSVSSAKRRIGTGIVTAFVVVYNLALYQATRDVSFSFQGDNPTLKWYALTPEGVKYFDRDGRDPVYGMRTCGPYPAARFPGGQPWPYLQATLSR